MFILRIIRDPYLQPVGEMAELLNAKAGATLAYIC
jgi:hypothetical protein